MAGCAIQVMKVTVPCYGWTRVTQVTHTLLQREGLMPGNCIGIRLCLFFLASTEWVSIWDLLWKKPKAIGESEEEFSEFARDV